jgi:hypothetical protein
MGDAGGGMRSSGGGAAARSARPGGSSEGAGPAGGAAGGTTGGTAGKPRAGKRARALSRYDVGPGAARGEASREESKRQRAQGPGGEGDREGGSGQPRRKRHNPEKSESVVERERRLAKRYHRIKFYDRIKTERRLRFVLNQLKASKMDKELLAQKHALLDDLRYVRFFPRGEKYISLFTENATEQVKTKLALLRAFALRLSTRSSRGNRKQLMSFMNKRAGRKGDDADDEQDDDDNEAEGRGAGAQDAPATDGSGAERDSGGALPSASSDNEASEDAAEGASARVKRPSDVAAHQRASKPGKRKAAGTEDEAQQQQQKQDQSRHPQRKKVKAARAPESQALQGDDDFFLD